MHVTSRYMKSLYIVPFFIFTSNWTLLLIFLLIVIFLYFFNYSRPSKIELYHNEEIDRQQFKKLTYLHGNYQPTPYLCTTLLQALYNHKTSIYKGDLIEVKFERIWLKTKDGGQISIDEALIPNSKKICLIFHGLTGGSEMPYIRALVKELHSRSFSALIFHNRGVNKTDLITPEPYHGIKLDDIDLAFNYTKTKYNNHNLYAIGVSFGANQLIRYMSETGFENKLKASVLLSMPFDLVQTAKNLNGSIYAKGLIRSFFKNIITPNKDILEKNHPQIDFKKLAKTTDIIKFHSDFSCKIFDYENGESYLRAANITKKIVEKIKINSLILYSKDDPMCPRDAMPLKELLKNKKILMAETKTGGHACWFTGNKPQRWFPKPTVQFLEQF